MPDETVKVVYTADTQQYTQSLSEAMQATERYAEVVDNAVGKVAKAGITVSKAMMAVGGRGMRMTPAVQQAAAYEQQLSLLGARAKISGQNITELNRNVKKLARDYPIGMGTATEQYEALQRTGKSGKQLKELTEQMTKLGAATGEMGQGLTTSMSQFSRTFKQFDTKGVSNLSDSVASLSSKFGTSASSMLDFANAIAPLGKQLGMSSTEVLGFSTAFGRAGEDGYRAANVFNQMMSDMERAVRVGAPQIRTYAESVGMTTDQFKLLAEENPTEAMTRFFEAINKNGDDSIRILEELGMDGVRTYKAITAVAGQGDIRKIQEEAAATYGSGASARAAEEAFNGLNDSMSKTSESMSQLVSASATPYVKVMGDVADVTAGVTGKFAEVAESDKMQKAIQMMTYAGMAMMPLKGLVSLGTTIQTGKFATGALAATGAISRAAQSPVAQWGRENAGMLKYGAMAGGAIGLMSGSPEMMALSAAAMLLGPGQGGLNKLRTGAGKATSTMLDMFGSPVGAEPWKQIVGITPEGERERRRGGRGYGRMQALSSWASGMDDPSKDPGMKARWGKWRRDLSHMYTQEEVKELNDARKAARAATWDDETKGARWRQAKLLGRQGVNIPLQSLGAVGSTMGGLAGMLGPTAAIAGLAAGGAFAYSQYGKGKEASADPSSLVKMANAAGLATKGLEQFAQSMEKTTKSATSTADALDVTQEEIGMIGKSEYEVAFKGAAKGRSEEQVRRAMLAEGQNQTAQVQQRIINDVAKNYGAEFAERLGKEVFGPGATGSAMTAAGEFSKAQAESAGGGAFGQMRYYATGRRQESIDMMQSAAQNMHARFQEDQEIYGDYMAYQNLLGRDVDEVTKAMSLAIDDRTIEEAVMGLEGMSQDEAAKIKDRAEDLETLYRPGTEQYYSAEEAARQAIVESEWYENASKLRNEARKKGESLIPDLAEAGITGMADLKTAIDKSKEADTEMDKLLSEFDAYQAAKEKRAVVGEKGLEEAEKTAISEYEAKKPGEKLTGAEAFAARGYLYYESPKVQAEQQARYLQAAQQGVDIQGILEAGMANIERKRQESGEVPTMALQQLLQQASGGLQAAQLMEGGTWTGRQARETRLAAYRGGLAPGQPGGVTTLEGAPLLTEKGWINKAATPQFSKDPVLAKQQQEWYMGLQQEEQAVAQQQRSFLMSYINMQKQQAFQQSEFQISAGQSREDAAKNERRQRESLARSQERATDDFNKSRQRQTDDFNKSMGRAQDDYDKQMARAHEDYQKQMTRSDADFYKQRQRGQDDFQKSTLRATEDFNRQMARAGEEMARNMLNPMERIGAARTWSAGGLAGNLKEQNEAVKEQLKVLDDLRSQGLSQETIDLLGLAQAGNARQTISLQGMTQEEIAALNEQAGQRMDLGAQINEEQVGYRQAYEDFQREMARQQEDFNLQMARMDEDFATSRARAAEDFNLQILRSNEDFNLQMARQTEDFYLNMGRAQEDFQLSLVRQNEDLRISLSQMWEDLNTALGRQADAMARAAAHSQELMRDSMKELTMTDAQREQWFAEAWEGEFTGWEGFMVSRLETGNEFIAGTSGTAQTGIQNTSGKAQGAIEGTAATAQGEIDTTATNAQGSIATSASKAQGNLANTANSASTTANAFSVAAQGEIKDLTSVATTAINDITTVAKKADSDIQTICKTLGDSLAGAFRGVLSGMETAYTTTVDSITKKMAEVPGKIKDSMKEFAWILDEKNHVAGKAHEIVIKTDEENFKKTWAKLLESGGAPPGGGGGGPAPGTPSDYSGPLAVTGGKGSISQQWGVANSRYAAGRHTGIDISAPTGTPIYSTYPGVVSESRMDKSYGNMVMIDDAHSDIQVLYGHMTQRLVTAGQRVEKGTNIGKVGSTGNSTGPHVHVEARKSPYKYGNDINPASWLAAGAIITGATKAMLGEGGPEAVLPLNSQGAQFLTEVMGRYSSVIDAKSSRTAGYSISHTDNSTHIHNDSSVHTGNVTVVSNNADEFAASIRRKQARERLGSKV